MKADTDISGDAQNMANETGDDGTGDEERPMTEFLLDQFAGWHLICVLAVKALNEARRQHSARNRDVGA
jgi:hypothetical protein